MTGFELQPYTLNFTFPAHWAIPSVEYCQVQLLCKKVSCFSCGKFVKVNLTFCLKVFPNYHCTGKSIMADFMGPWGFFVPHDKWGMYTFFKLEQSGGNAITLRIWLLGVACGAPYGPIFPIFGVGVPTWISINVPN